MEFAKQSEKLQVEQNSCDLFTCSLRQRILHPIKTICVCSVESKVCGSRLHNEIAGGVRDKIREVKYERYVCHCRSSEHSKVETKQTHAYENANFTCTYTCWVSWLHIWFLPIGY